MTILNDLSAISYDALNDWLEKRQKSEKHLLKRMYNKLMTQLIVFDNKLSTYQMALTRDEDDVKTQLRLNNIKIVIAEYEQYIDLVHKKILSFETSSWNRLSSVQHEELLAFEYELRDVSDEELNNTFYTKIKQEKAQYFHEILILEQQTEPTSDEEYVSWTEKMTRAKNGHTFATFKLRYFENEWFHRRVLKIATLPTPIQDKTTNFFYNLRNYSDETLLSLKDKYEKKLESNQSNPSFHHVNTQLDVFITDIQLELKSRNIKEPKLISPERPWNSPTSIIPPPESAPSPIQEDKENDLPRVHYRTTKVKVLFNHSTTAVSETPQRPEETPSIMG